MNYYLHRISHEAQWSYPLLEQKGLLSIGWADFGIRKGFVSEHEDDWSKVPRTIEDEWGKVKSRFCLQRFLEMKKGDRVVVPTWGAFHLYEVFDDERLVAAQIDVGGLHNSQQHAAEVGDDGYLYNSKSGKNVDLGFFRRVKVVARSISRADYADADLTRRMKVRLTNVNVTDLKQSIEYAIREHEAQSPINAHQLIVTECAQTVLDTIVRKMNPSKFESLIRSYLEHQGASAFIPPKNDSGKKGDADIIATFEPLRLIVYVQAKYHRLSEGETDEWAVEQVDEYMREKKVADGYGAGEQYASLAWAVSSGEFSAKSVEMAQVAGIRLIGGIEFSKMLLDAGVAHLKGL